MAEQSLSRLKTKTGLVGLVIFLVGAVRTVLSLLQDFEYTRENVGSIAGFLDTPLGNAAVTMLGVVVVLWAIYRRQPEDKSPESTSGNGAAAEVEPEDRSPRQTVEWKAQRFSIPTTEDAQDRLMLLTAENEQSDSPDPLIELLADSERARARLEAERDETREVVDALKKELNEARQEFSSQESLPSDEELKQRSLRLSEELFRFLEERAKENPQTGAFSRERRRYDEKTRNEYSRRFRGDVAALLNALERREWCSPEEHKRLESFTKTPETRIRLTAEHLATVGRRL